MNNMDLAVILARGIFTTGDYPGDHVQRIEFKGGIYPGRETALGGLNESALRSVIFGVLERSQSNPGGAK